MTGAGSASMAFVKEASFRTLPGTPTYYLPGRNPTIDELSLDNVLTRLRTPSNAEAVDSLAGNLEGSFAATWNMSADTHADVRDIVFNDGGSGFVSGLAPSSRWYLGAEYVDDTGTATDTVERELEGCIPLEYTITYQQDTNSIRESVTFGYADEVTNTSFTPSSITGPTDGSCVPFHGLSVDVDGVTVEDEQSLTLTYNNISRFQRGSSRTANNAVLAQPEGTLDITAIYHGRKFQDLAYGGSGVSTTQDTPLENVSGTLTFSSEGATVATFELPKLKPDTYDWDDLINADTDLTDPTTFHINDGVSIS